MATNEFTKTKVVTGKVRLSYLHVFTPYAFQPGSTEKYSVVILIPKTDKVTVGKIKQAIQAAKDQMREKNNGKLPAKLDADRLHDGDEPDENGEQRGAEYKGHWYVNASSKTRPGVVDINLNPITDQEEIYSGCYGRVSITFYPFDMTVNKGIGCGLNNVQKICDGEPLGGRTSPETDFAEPIEDDDLL
jgi:hypothetical protein